MQRGRLKPTWAPEGVTVPHRCNGGVRADAPQGTTGHIASDGGLIKPNGQTVAVAVSSEAVRTTGESPGVPRRPQPWREAKRGTEERTPRREDNLTARRRRAETGLAANVGDDAPQPPHWTAARIGVEGSTQLRLRLRASWCAGRRIAHHN